MPPFSDDDVLDYVVREAIVFKVAHEREKAEKAKERADFRSSHKDLRSQSGAATWQKEMTHAG